MPKFSIDLDITLDCKGEYVDSTERYQCVKFIVHETTAICCEIHQLLVTLEGLTYLSVLPKCTVPKVWHTQLHYIL